VYYQYRVFPEPDPEVFVHRTVASLPTVINFRSERWRMVSEENSVPLKTRLTGHETKPAFTQV
jgi:hypothetical protein